MSVLAGLEKRLEESEQRLTELIQHLERQQSLEESLGDAGRGLGEASSNLGEVAASTKAALESLKSIVDALQETVGILARSNPAETAEAVARLEKEFGAAQRETTNVIVKELESSRQDNKKAIDEVSKQVAQARVGVEAAVQGESANAAAEIQGALKEISGQQSRSQSIALRIGYVTLIVILVVLGIETLRFFQ